jgi:two-component system LytT family response regulator
MKILICENEHPAIKQLSKLIKKVRKDAEIVATAETGEEAIEILSEYEPDLIFLDVELADGPCFETFKDLDIRFPIIFTTAFDEYALKAFKMNSIDYLLKPISEKEIERAFRKYESMKSTFESIMREYDQEAKMVIGKDESRLFEEKIEAILEKKVTTREYIKRLSIKNNGTIRLVQTSDIQWIESDGNYINIYTDQKKYFMRSTLSGFLKQLDGRKFFQIHKSVVLNIDFVDYVEEAEHGDFIVIMTNGERLKMSRNYKSILESA